MQQQVWAKDTVIDYAGRTALDRFMGEYLKSYALTSCDDITGGEWIKYFYNRTESEPAVILGGRILNCEQRGVLLIPGRTSQVQKKVVFEVLRDLGLDTVEKRCLVNPMPNLTKVEFNVRPGISVELGPKLRTEDIFYILDPRL